MKNLHSEYILARKQGSGYTQGFWQYSAQLKEIKWITQGISFSGGAEIHTSDTNNPFSGPHDSSTIFNFKTADTLAITLNGNVKYTKYETSPTFYNTFSSGGLVKPSFQAKQNF